MDGKGGGRRFHDSAIGPPGQRGLTPSGTRQQKGADVASLGAQAIQRRPSSSLV